MIRDTDICVYSKRQSSSRVECFSCKCCVFWDGGHNKNIRLESLEDGANITR